MRIVRWLCTALLMLLGQAVLAANFEISPVLVTLSAEHATDAIRIINRDQHPVSIQVRCYDWRQINGEDVLEPAGTVLLSPPLFTLAPGASQTVRLLAKTAAGAREIAYRVLIDQIPVSGDGEAINFKFRVSLPVFMAPVGAARPQLSWKVVAGPSPHILVSNEGNRRAKLSALSITMPDGERLTPAMGVHSYILANTTRRFPFVPHALLSPGARVLVSVASEAGLQTLDIDAISP